MNSPERPSTPRLNLPSAQFRVKLCDDGVWRIHDRLRRRFVALTPEEWVRQNFVDWLITAKGFPEHLMANEVALTFNDTRRRCDTVLFAPSASAAPGSLCPLAVVEYKAPGIEITQRVFDQIARYNMVMGAPLLIVSNGMRHFCCLTCQEHSGQGSGESRPYTFLRDIPDYQHISSLR